MVSSETWKLERILATFASPELAKQTHDLRGEEALALIQPLDWTLRNYKLHLDVHRRCLKALRILGCAEVTLPDACIIQKGLVADFSERVACGGFADVYKGTLNGKVVAVKMLRCTEEQKKNEYKDLIPLLVRETIVWSHLQHDNIVKFMGACLDPNNGDLYIASLWMEHGTLRVYIHKYPTANRLQLILDVICGLIYMHELRLIHSDVKGANILINDKRRACLTDFGLMTAVLDPQATAAFSTHTSGGGGTTRWMAPELLDPDEFGLDRPTPTFATDIYALGMVILEAMAGEVPFASLNDLQVVSQVGRGKRPKRPSRTEELGFTDEVWKITEACWSHASAERPRLKKVQKCLEAAASSWKPPQTIS